MKHFLTKATWLSGLLWFGSLATAADIPPAMMAKFSQLSPAQQQALAAQYGLDLKQLKAPSAPSKPVADSSAPTLEERNIDSSLASQRPLMPVRNNALQPFGYNVFAGEPTSQTPLQDMPVPDDYVVGPGDEIKVQFYGKENDNFAMTVGREGQIDFPKLGPINVAGLTFQQVREELQSRIAEQFIGVDSYISFGSLRTMQIFVMGDAYKPGAYNVNGLTTVTQALQIAGGIDTVGSLRHIQVKRAGQVIENIDLYRMLVWGDSSQDIRLAPGDTVFVAPKGSEVTIKGLVKRPAIYELESSAALSAVLDMAGGLKAAALREISVNRPTETGTRVYNLNLANSRDRGFTIKDGDVIDVLPTTTELANAIAVKGAVVRQGTFSYEPGMRISRVLKSVERDLKGTADLDYALVVREVNSRRDIDVMQFNLGRAIRQPGSLDDLILQPRDQLLIFNVDARDLLRRGGNTLTEKSVDRALQAKNRELSRDESERTDAQTGAEVSQKEITNSDQLTLTDLAGSTATEAVVSDSRQALLAPVIERLKAQAAQGKPVQIAEVRGEVKFPGIYPLARQTTLRDLVIAAGGLQESADVAELSRVTLGHETLNISHTRKTLSEVMAQSGSPLAESKDSLNILPHPEWREEATVQVFGEVKYPGTYTVRRGESLHELISRVGGLSPYANPKGAVFAREALRKQEAERITFLRDQLRQEISTLALRRQSASATYTSSPTEALAMVNQLESNKAVGRLSINMPAIIKGEKQADILLEDGDKLYVPSLQNVVSVVGQVQYPSSHSFDGSLNLDDYINRAGGTKKQADTDRTYVIKADGSVMLPGSNYWFSRKDRALEPGDTIVVPIDSDYIDNLSVMTSATQILYQLGVAWSAINN